MNISPKTVGAIAGAMAAAAYGLNPLFAIPLYKMGLTPTMVLFYRFALAALMLVPVLWLKRCKFALTKNEAVASFAGSALMVTSSLCLYTSFKYMDIGLSMTLLFLYPVFVAVIMSTAFGEKLSLAIISSIILALSGLAMVTLPGKGGDSQLFITWTGVMLAVGSALSYAFYIVAVRKSSMRNLSSEKLTFYTAVFAVPFFLILLDCGTSVPLPDSWSMGWNLLGVAFFPTVVALVFMAVAIEKIGATPAAILGVLEPVTGLLVGILLFGEKLTVLSTLGIVLIFSSVLLVIAGDRKKADKTR